MIDSFIKAPEICLYTHPKLTETNGKYRCKNMGQARMYREFWWENFLLILSWNLQNTVNMYVLNFIFNSGSIKMYELWRPMTDSFIKAPEIHLHTYPK